MRAIDLLELQEAPAERALVIVRDDLREDTDLTDSLRRLGVEVDHRRLPGYIEMMEEPHFSRVPDEVVAGVEEWVGRASPDFAGDMPVSSPPVSAESGDSSSDVPSQWVESAGKVQESFARFGPERGLFGVLAESPISTTRAGLAVLLLTTGAVHHIGANRIYVDIARRLAALGVISLRYDVAGIGDSPAEDERWENHPYPPRLESDALAAIEHLRRERGCDRFVLAGLCSGAYAAFRAALIADGVVETIMINPLTFEWKEGMTLMTPPHQHYADVSHYRRSIRRWSSWKRMLSGQADVRRIMAVSFRHARNSARGNLRSLTGKSTGGGG